MTVTRGTAHFLDWRRRHGRHSCTCRPAAAGTGGVCGSDHGRLGGVGFSAMQAQQRHVEQIVSAQCIDGLEPLCVGVLPIWSSQIEMARAQTELSVCDPRHEYFLFEISP